MRPWLTGKRATAAALRPVPLPVQRARGCKTPRRHNLRRGASKTSPSQGGCSPGCLRRFPAPASRGIPAPGQLSAGPPLRHPRLKMPRRYGWVSATVTVSGTACCGSCLVALPAQAAAPPESANGAAWQRPRASDRLRGVGYGQAPRVPRSALFAAAHIVVACQAVSISGVWFQIKASLTRRGQGSLCLNRCLACAPVGGRAFPQDQRLHSRGLLDVSFREWVIFFSSVTELEFVGTLSHLCSLVL